MFFNLCRGFDLVFVIVGVIFAKVLNFIIKLHNVINEKYYYLLIALR